MNVLLGMNSRSYKGFKIGIMATLFTVLAAFNLTPFETENEEVNIIVIDAGHGGHDPGNLGTGRYRKKEKDVSYDVSCVTAGLSHPNHIPSLHSDRRRRRAPPHCLAAPPTLTSTPAYREESQRSFRMLFSFTKRNNTCA